MEMNGHAAIKISIVMPAYCCERFIAKSIESVLNQTFRHFELIVIDDCSTDGTAEIIREYALKDSRIVYMCNEKNHGVARTRNKGIAKSKGEYIALLDSDDLWENTFLEKQMALAESTDADILYCSYAIIDESEQRIKKPFIVPERTDFTHMLSSSVISCSAVLAKAALLKEHPFKPEIYHEDYALWLELLSTPIVAVGNPEILSYYRQVQGSRSWKKGKAARERWRIYREVLHMDWFVSMWYFIQYAVKGMMKYYL